MNSQNSRNKTDTSLLPIKYLIPDWVQRLREDCENEETGPDTWPVQLLPGRCRWSLWNMTSIIGGANVGVPGQACRLLERYLAVVLRRRIRALRDVPADAVEREWASIKESLGRRIPLLLASCVQLAAKMNCSSIELHASTVRERLLAKGISYSLDDIIESEHDVFRVLGYRIPLWRTAESAELIHRIAGVGSFSEIGRAPATSGVLPLTMELAECLRDRLARRAAYAAGTNPTTAGSGLRSVHLSAAAVIVTARLGGSACPLARAAALLGAPPALLGCLADQLLAAAVGDGDDTTATEDDDDSLVTLH